MGRGGSRHEPADLPPGKRPRTHFIGDWVGARAGLEGTGKPRPHRNFLLFSVRISSVLVSLF